MKKNNESTAHSPKPSGWLITGKSTHLFVKQVKRPSFVVINGSDPVVSIEAQFPAKEILALGSRELRLEKALREIAGIENEMVGGDWEEIERAREIAEKALGLEPDACISRDE